MEKNIAFFDFDGTITTEDTMLQLAKYKHGLKSYWLGMLLISPWLVAMKIGLVSKTRAKEKFLLYFFGNVYVDIFNNDCLLFATNILPNYIKKDALLEISKHKKNSTHVVVVSASAENWVAPWCIKHDIEFICTKLEIKNQKITGKLFGKNCNGIEKVSRIKEKFDTANFTNIYCYGDTTGDKEMLELATHPYYRTFLK